MHTWKTRPTEKQLKTHINGFITALSKADFSKAFTLCPVSKGKAFVDPSVEKAFQAFLKKFLPHALFQAIEFQECMEEFEDEFEEKKPETWARFLTPPAELGYKDLALSVPDEGEGEVLANVALNNEVTDITGRYQLIDGKEGWILSFSNFDVM